MTDKEAQAIAHGLVQGYIGPDHRVMDMSSFYGARWFRRYSSHTCKAGGIEPNPKGS